MIHHRSTGEAAAVLDVDPDSRIITCIAAPYGQTALVPFRGTTWREQFEPGAFDGADASKIRVCREHRRHDTVGRVVKFDFGDARGLLADIRIAATSRGTDTLQLAREGCLSASVAFGVRAGGEILDQRNKTRYITKAFLDHVGLTM